MSFKINIDFGPATFKDFQDLTPLVRDILVWRYREKMRGNFLPIDNAIMKLHSEFSKNLNHAVKNLRNGGKAVSVSSRQMTDFYRRSNAQALIKHFVLQNCDMLQAKLAWVEP